MVKYLHKLHCLPFVTTTKYYYGYNIDFGQDNSPILGLLAVITNI